MSRRKISDFWKRRIEPCKKKERDEKRKEREERKKKQTNKQNKQGRIHGYPSFAQVGRGSDGEGHWGIWAGAMSSKRSKMPKK